MKHSVMLSAMLLLMGCYHATVETGATPSAEVYSKSFASGWIFGLVPPNTVSTAQRCSSGVAKVETHLSFANQLVGFLTGRIYTPMNIKVTCASRSASDDLDTPMIHAAQPSPEILSRALNEAVELSQTTGRAVMVTW